MLSFQFLEQLFRLLRHRASQFCEPAYPAPHSCELILGRRNLGQTWSQIMKVRQPMRRPLGGFQLLLPVTPEENLSNGRPRDFFLEKKPKGRHIDQRLWNGILRVLIEAFSPQGFHRSVDVRTVKGVNLADQLVKDTGGLQSDFHRAAAFLVPP